MFLSKVHPALKSDTLASINITRTYHIFENCIRENFQDLFKVNKQVANCNPLETFLVENFDHPLMDDLLDAIEKKNARKSEMLTNCGKTYTNNKHYLA